MKRISISLSPLVLTLALLFAAPDVLAQQNGAGPDTVICKGGSVTLGTGAQQSGYCYYWEPPEGLSDRKSLHPTASPAQTTTYTLYVQGPDLGPPQYSDQVTVTVIEIKDVVFNPAQILANGTATSQASATVIPGGRTLVWTIEGPNLGCTINQSTGLITAGTQGGNVKVRATDAALAQSNTSCFAEASLCVGDGSECCGEVNASRSFGPLTVSIPGGPYQPTGPQDAQGYCPYTVQAGLAMDFAGAFSKSASLTGVTVSWKEKYNDPSQYKDVTVTWTGSVSIGQIGVVEAFCTEISVTVNSGGNLAGTAKFNINLTQDVSVGDIAFLRSGLNGDFTFTFNNSNSWSGAWDFTGLTGFRVDLVKGGNNIASVTAASFDANGVIHDAVFAVATPATWNTNSFNAELTQCSLTMDYDINNNDVTFKSGTGEIKLTQVTGVDGDITLGLAFTQTNVTVTVGLANGKAFGCTITGTLSTTMGYDFELQEIAGSNISAKHDDFDQSFTNVNFKIKDGAIEEFSFASLQVKYKNKIEFELANASYTKAAQKLTLDMKVALPALQLQVEEFSINHQGAVNVTRIIGDVNKSPITMHIELQFQATEFSGQITGTFIGGVGINATVVVGATATFNYGHFAIGIALGNGIPLGNSGLKVKTLSGEFGYNWAAPTLGGGSGGPQLGTTTIGFGLGISDIADLCLIEGYIRFILGNASTMQLQGNVKVTANPPHYFNGQLTVEYTLGSGQILGQISSQIKFPASSGSVVDLNTGNINFKISSSRWYVTGPSITGKIFSNIDLTGSLNIWAYLGSSGSVNGTINGSLSYDYTWSYAYPSGFDASSCAAADASDNWAGFGISGNLQIHLGGSISAAMNSNGIVGSVSVEASASSTMSVKWPCFITCGSNCVYTYSVQVEGNLTVSYSGSSMRVQGSVTFKNGSESEQGDIDITI